MKKHYELEYRLAGDEWRRLGGKYQTIQSARDWVKRGLPRILRIIQVTERVVK